MAETTEKRTRKRASAKSAHTDASQGVEANTPIERKVRKSLSPDMAVCCTCAVASGNLIYKSKRLQGREIMWDTYGSSQSIELAELEAMRNSYPTFFKENWILIDDDDVLNHLHASQYYRDVKSIRDIENIFQCSPKEILRRVPKWSNGLKTTLAIIARRKYDAGELDSLQKIKNIEQATGRSIVNH